MGLMDLLKTSDPMEKFYAAAEKSNIPQGGVTGAAFKAMFPYGLGNLAFGKEPEPMPDMASPQGTQMLAELVQNVVGPGTFIGPKGMARLFGDDAAKGMLATAESKLAQGVPKEAVFQELGVFKGPEGKWRYEIDDTGAGFKPMEDWSWGSRTGLKQGESRVSDPLGVMVQHPELERAYPNGFFDFGNENKRLLAEVNTNAVDSGSFDGTTVSVGMKDGKPNDSTLLHELQHAIQEREGFAAGGAPEWNIDGPSFWPPFTPPHDVVEAAEKLLELQRVHGIAPADSAAKYRGAFKLDDEFMNQAIELVTSGELPKIQSKVAKYRGKPFDIYQRLAGEAESRAVQDRMSMSMQERRASFPDYAARDDLIIRGLMSGVEY